MGSKLARLAWLPTLLVGLVFAACGDQAAPEQLLGPESAVLAKGGNGQGWGKGGKAAKDGNLTLKDRKNGKQWKVARGRVPRGVEYKAEKIVGPEGGMLQTAEHVLMVPAGAVDVPTRFKLSIERPAAGDTANVMVDLKATVVDESGDEIDVGHLGFNRPVYLGLSYAWVVDTFDLTQATVVWVPAPGIAEPVRTFEVDYRGRWIVAELDHFSQYALAWP